MHLDVQDLRNFYYRTRLGRVAQRGVRERIQSLWPAEGMRGLTLVGFGFAVPMLRPYLGTARRVAALMPGPQGVMPWPAGGPNVSVLCEETWWPLETGHVDRLMMLHGLDTSENQSAVLAEAYRVLGPGGRALFVVPNRGGLWARGDGTPFGYGKPYSLSQLETQLRLHDFEPVTHRAALYGPPSEKRFWLKSADLWERAGRRVSNSLAGGVFVVEAAKQYPPRGSLVSNLVRDPFGILDGVTQPSPKPI